MKSDLEIGLPLRLRLRRALLIALILGAWAPFKILWEQDLSKEQDFLRYQGAPVMTRQLRDELGQGLTIGVLSGMRNVIADVIWVVNVGLAWQDEQWFKMDGYINLCTALQPRSIVFWDIGGWHLAWNASIAVLKDPTQPSELRRLKASHFWIEKGLEVYKRGIENNPESWRLWADTGLLYQQRLGDYRAAAHYYSEATKRPNCPVYYERFPAIMYDFAGDEMASYEAWKELWNRLTPAQRAEKQHWAGRNTALIRRVEAKLSIPPEKRIFPN